MAKSIILYDRSRTTADWKCPRSRWWQYEYGGKGIVSGNTSLELFMGTILHDGMSAIAHQHVEGGLDGYGKADIDLIASTAQKQMFETLMAHSAGEDEFEATTFANEQAALVEGLLRGFHRHVWPSITSRYPIIMAIEEEMTYPHDGIVFMAKPDLVVVDHDGNVWYWEYKSTSSKKDGWINSWNTAVQLHSTVRAIEHTIKDKVTGVVVQGLYKGFESYGKQSSPFCYSYQRKGNPPFSKDEVAYEYKAGFKRYATWEMEGGVKAWVEGMPENILADQFPQAPPIFIKDDLVDTFFKQCNVREREIDMAMELMKISDDEAQEDILNTAFKQHFDQCFPAWGKPCTYRSLCHSRVEDPLQQGFEWREPHHKPEVEARNE